MSGMIKYRVHEVAKDFNMTSKEVTKILTDYATTPKNHMQVLEDGELDVIFEYLTQHHQIASLEDVYKVPAKPAAKPEKAPAADAPAAARRSPHSRLGRAHNRKKRRKISRTSRVRWRKSVWSIRAARRRTCPSTISTWTILCRSARRI